jgi:hypothetical protein
MRDTIRFRRRHHPVPQKMLYLLVEPNGTHFTRVTSTNTDAAASVLQILTQQRQYYKY